MFKVNIKDTRKMSKVALLVSLLLTLNMFYTFIHSASFVEFEQLSRHWHLRYVVLLDINRTCMSFINLCDLWCMNLYFISVRPIFMNAYIHGLALMLCLIMCYWHDKKQQKCFLNIHLEATKTNFSFIVI